MNDMTATIVAKSDQINAADLIGKPRTVTVREVRIKAGEDQPVTIMIEGDEKAFRPCKGVRRLLVRAWGPDAGKYIGQSLTLFCDPTVTWAGKPEGGIRVSHMSGLSEKIIEFMRTSRAATKPYTILPLKDAPAPKQDGDPAKAWADKFVAACANAADLTAFEAVLTKSQKNLATIADRDDLHPTCEQAISEARTRLAVSVEADEFGEVI